MTAATLQFISDDGHRVGKVSVFPWIPVRVAQNLDNLSLCVFVFTNLLVVDMAANPDCVMVEHVEILLPVEVEECVKRAIAILEVHAYFVWGEVGHHDWWLLLDKLGHHLVVVGPDGIRVLLEVSPVVSVKPFTLPEKLLVASERCRFNLEVSHAHTAIDVVHVPAFEQMHIPERATELLYCGNLFFGCLERKVRLGRCSATDEDVVVP